MHGKEYEMDRKRTIWQNYDINLEDYQEFLEEEHPDVTDEYEKEKLVLQMNDEYLEEERADLCIELPEDIILIAHLGRWDRSPLAYKELKSNNLSDCLLFERNCDYAEWFIDNLNDLRSRQSHHDGDHNILFRMWRPGISEERKANFFNKIYSNKATRRDITRYTVSLGGYVDKAYDWSAA